MEESDKFYGGRIMKECGCRLLIQSASGSTKLCPSLQESVTHPMATCTTSKAQYTPPPRHNCRVESRRRCVLGI